MMKLKSILFNVSTLVTVFATVRNVLWIPASSSLSPSLSPPSSTRNETIYLAQEGIRKANLISNHEGYLITSGASRRQTADQALPGNIADATIIITSNYIPTHPSTDIIDRTIESISRFIVFPHDDPSSKRIKTAVGTTLHDSSTTNRTRIPMLITVDGLNERERRTQGNRREALDQYIRTLTEKYTNHPYFEVQILPQPLKVKLIQNMQFALKFVTTKYIYVIQHDLPFVLPVSHHAMVHFFEEIPETVRLIRFGRHQTMSRNKDWPSKVGVDCGDELFLPSRYPDGISLSKTHTWSDK